MPDMSDTDDSALFSDLRATGSRRVRNELVERHMGLATHISQRYSNAGSAEDVRQVAMVGLVKAVDRFDPAHGAAFSSFAGRTIEGEIKRYFRDKTWTVRVPRGAKELHLLVRQATDHLGQQLGRSPSVDEVATHLDLDRGDVLRGLAATEAARVGSLDTRAGDDDDGPTDRSAAIATHDVGFDATLDEHVVDELLARLPEREREIVRRRFYDRQSQSDIAEAMDMSQMHVSRLLRRSFEQMRAWLGDLDG